MIDAGIYQLAGRGVKSVADYDAEASKARQNRLAEMMSGAKMDEYRRGITDQNALRQTLQGFGSDQGANQLALLRGGHLKEAQDYAKSNADTQKSQADTQYKQLETSHKRLEVIGQGLGFLKDNPSMENAQRVIDGFVQSGIMDAQTAQEKMAAFQADPSPQGVQKLATMGYQGALSTKDQLPTYQTRNTGGTTDTLSINPVTGQVAVANSVQNTQSPESIASAETQRRGQDMSAGTARRGQDLTNSRGKTLIEIRQQEATQKQAGSNKPLPVGALRMRVEAQDAADTADGVNERLASVEKRITDEKLSFGPVSNLVSAGLNATGMSTENSRNFASFKSEMEKLRNDSLRLNKGVQTDGDAQRAWNELFQNINDTKLVQQRLTEIKQINARAKNLRLMEVDTIDRNYGRAGNAAPAQRSVMDEADAILNGE